jgi:hypothetical protein
MSILSEYITVGWGVFWEESGRQCSVLKVSEAEALAFASHLLLPKNASIEQVYRRRPQSK